MLRGGICPAQQRADARLELQNVEGLCDIVVRTGLKADDLIGVLAAGGEHDDRHIRKLADAHTGRQPVHLRHHEIKNDQVEIARFGHVDRGRAVVGGLDRVALVLQIEFHALDQELFIVNDQNLHCVPPL